MKVVCNVGQVFYGVGNKAKRFRRGDIVEIVETKLPKWAVSIPEATKKATKKAEPVKEPTTLSEMTEKMETGKTKAFGQEV